MARGTNTIVKKNRAVDIHRIRGTGSGSGLGTGSGSDRETGTVSPEQVITARQQKLRDQAEITAFLGRAALMVVILAGLFGVVLGIASVGNNDMEPVLSAGDLVVYFRLDGSYVSGDVLVYEVDGEEYIGRVVAKGGDTVEITDNAQVVINGSTLVESDIFYSTPAYDTDVTYPLTLAEDEYFLLCDYRTRGTDSRYHGAVRTAQIKGVLIAAIRREGL